MRKDLDGANWNYMVENLPYTGIYGLHLQDFQPVNTKEVSLFLKENFNSVNDKLLLSINARGSF
jgi:hypothetical protein